MSTSITFGDIITSEMNNEKPKMVTQRQFLDQIPPLLADLSEDDRSKVLIYMSRELGASVRNTEYLTVFSTGIKDHLARVAINGITNTMLAKEVVSSTERKEYRRLMDELLRWAETEED